MTHLSSFLSFYHYFNCVFFSDVFVDWKQNVNEVIVRLRCGDSIQRKEDVNTSFTDKSCHVSFPGKNSANLRSLNVDCQKIAKD